MVATVKIIPFAVPRAAVEAAAAFAAEGGPLLRVAAFVPRRVALIQTRLPGLKESILDKTGEVTRQRLAALGCTLAAEERCDHNTADLAPRIAAAMAAGADMVLVARRLGDRRPARRDPGGDRCGRRRRSSISACRSIPATCCCSAGTVRRRCWACPAAPVRPRSTASTGCWSASLPG